VAAIDAGRPARIFRRMPRISMTLLLSLLVLLAPPTSMASDEESLATSPARTLQAGYVVRWGGIEIGRFDTELRRTGAEYHLGYHARTSGPLGWVVDFSSTGWSAGRLDADTAAPRHFRGQSRWRDGEGFWRVSFGADGRVTELELDDATRADREPVPDAIQQGPDPLALMLQAMLEASAGERVEGRSFDGRRAMRYELACAAEPSPVQPVALGAETYQALLCEADGALLAGRSKRWSDRAEQQGRERSPVRIWLVPAVGGLPHWPVRIEADSRYGTVSVELTQFLDPAT
jgi:hypothetical protein